MSYPYTEVQMEKMFRTNEMFYDNIIPALPGNLAKKKYWLYADNLIRLATNRFEKGFLLWRKDIDPRSAFEQGLKHAEDGKVAAQEHGILLSGGSYTAMLTSVIVGTLTDYTFELPSHGDDFELRLYNKVLPIICGHLVEAPTGETISDVTAIYVDDQDYPHHKLFIGIYKKLEEILLVGRDAENIETLVKDAEANFRVSAKDKFCRDGLSYFGYGYHNPYMANWQLAAVLKKIEYAGLAEFKWEWG